MASKTLRFEGRFNDASNFLSWKVMVTLLLEENDLWDIVKEVATAPSDPQ
jgi:NhaP-type Na+/H+ or K+/H+ antiporter